MIDDESNIDAPRIFKLTSGEEIITYISKVTDVYFVIEFPLEIRYNPENHSVYLSKWCLGSDYAKMMTLSGGAVMSVSAPSEVILKNYISFIERVTEEDDEESDIDSSDMESLPETPTYH